MRLYSTADMCRDAAPAEPVAAATGESRPRPRRRPTAPLMALMAALLVTPGLLWPGDHGGSPTGAGAPLQSAVAVPPAPAPVLAALADETIIQIGAYSRPARAAAAWTEVSTRFPPLAALEEQVATATVNGSTVYRLRAIAPSADAAMSACRLLQASDQGCLVIGRKGRDSGPAGIE